MADKNTRLIQFYEQCLKKGYLDMEDADQRLDAKVVAQDLGLSTGNMASLLTSAKELYEKTEKENARRAVDGELLLTISGVKNEVLSVYIRPDNSTYYTLDGGDKVEGIPTITVEHSGTIQYTFNPSRAIYTGATVGGITTGGIHHTQATVTERVHNTNKGYITASTNTKSITIRLVSFSPFVQQRFKRDAAYNALVSGDRITCMKDLDPAATVAILHVVALFVVGLVKGSSPSLRK